MATQISNGTSLNGNIDKSKEWQMEILMEKLQSKSSQFKSFTETSKAIRMSILDKRYALDSVEKSQHQKCLDALQHCIKVTSLQSMVERLESLTRQLGLKFMVGPSGEERRELFISSDMFYLEVVLETGGTVRDVKVHHEGKTEQQSCAELVNCLTRQDFADFTVQLEGLASIYQLNAEKKVKCKAFSALQSLETDLSTLAQLQTFMKEPFNLLHKSPVGILEKRKGGHPMKLTYLVSPYELLDPVRGKAEQLTVERVISRKLGHSATVCIEGSTAHKLPLTPIISVNRSINANNTPSYATLTAQNSAVVPACFSLKLSKPMPLCSLLAKRIQGLTQLECGENGPTHPLLSLVTQHVSEGQLDCANNRGLFVTLPDQHHCYFLTEGRGLNAVLVNGIPFTHPAHVPSILALLRQQALFNTVLSSCIRPNSKQDLENMIMFEITALSWQQLSVSLEHPIEESMATAEIDLSDISNVTCKIFGPGGNAEVCEITSELATKVLQRSLSIPITMRSVIKAWEQLSRRKPCYNGNENFSLPLGSDDPGGHNGTNGTHPLTDFSSLESKIKREHNSNDGNSDGSMNLSHSTHQSGTNTFLNDSVVGGFTTFDNRENNSVLSTMELSNLLSAPSSSTAEKSSKKHKRKAGDEMWKSPKRKPGDDAEMILESSSSDSTSMSTPSHDATSDLGIATPTSVLGFHSDLELSGLDPTELIGPDKVSSEYEGSGDGDDLEEILSGTNNSRPETKPRNKSRESSDDSKTMVPPSVSITPITANTTTPSQSFNSVLTGMGLERRPGIEIIPITATSSTALPSSITITPITASQSKALAEERNRERKSSKNRSEEKLRLEKKRKRNHDKESSMRPPGKLPVKQDPLTKPVSVSIKPTDISSLTGLSSSSASSILRKCTPSPTHGRGVSISKQSSPSSSGKQSSSSKSSSSHHSIKHSISSSPKHGTQGVASPKHSASPKHQTTSSTGKPSMSTLKSAANSPSSKTGDSLKMKSLSKDSSRDRDKKVSSSSNSAQQNEQSSPTGLDLSKSGAQGLVRNRKGSLSAVIDKLKSAQHCGSDIDVGNSSGKSSGSSSGRTSSPKVDVKSISSKSSETKNSEYMVKPSSDSMKIIINKTRTKESSKSSTSSSSGSSSSISKTPAGSGSPKTHTGLKPGVNSGPASKKPQQAGQKLQSSSVSSSSSTSNAYIKSSGSTGSGSGNKVSSSLNKGASVSISKSSATKSSSSIERSRDGRPRSISSKAEKSIFGSVKAERRSSPTTNIDGDSDRSFKLLPQQQSYTPIMVEGLIKQQLDTKFQIPKLSARTSVSNSDSDKKLGKVNSPLPDSSNINNVNPKINDMISQNDITTKYPIALLTSNKMFDGSIDKTVRNNLINTTTSSVTTILPTTVSNNPISLTASSSSNVNSQHISLDHDSKNSKSETLTVNSSLSKEEAATKLFSSCQSYSSINSNSESVSLSAKSHDSCANGKFATPQSKLDDLKKPSSMTELAMKVTTTTSQDVAEMLLDFSTTKSVAERSIGMLPPSHRGTPPLTTSSPSVSVHIVKSPVPSPLVQASPHSGSPCITDDELMDEALVGMGK